MRLATNCYSAVQRTVLEHKTQMLKHNRELYTQFHVTPTWYGDLLRYRHSGAMLVSDSDSDRVGPWTKGYLRTTTDGSGQVSNREGLLSCLTSAER